MANSPIVTKPFTWDGTSVQVEPTLKRFTVKKPILSQVFNWIMVHLANLGINALIDWESNYGSAQIFWPEKGLYLPDTGGPSGIVYVGNREPAYVLDPGVDSDLYCEAQIVRVDPAVVLTWSTNKVPSATPETVQFSVEIDINGVNDVPGGGLSTFTATPVINSTLNGETQTVIALGDLSTGGTVSVLGKNINMRVTRKGTDNILDTLTANPIHLKRIEVR